MYRVSNGSTLYNYWPIVLPSFQTMIVFKMYGYIFYKDQIGILNIVDFIQELITESYIKDMFTVLKWNSYLPMSSGGLLCTPYFYKYSRKTQYVERNSITWIFNLYTRDDRCFTGGRFIRYRSNLTFLYELFDKR